MLLLAISTTTYVERVPVVVGSKIIDKALSCMTMGELAKATATWWQAHFGAVMSGSLQLSHSSSEKLTVQNISGDSDPVEVQKYQLDGVKGAVCTTQKVTIPPFQTLTIKGNAGVKGHCMKVHVLTEPALGPQLPAAVVPIATYGELHPGSSRVPICLHTWALMPWKYQLKWWLDRSSLPTKYHRWSTRPGLLKRQMWTHLKVGFWRL